MYTRPFSFNRFLLYISCILGGAGLIALNNVFYTPAQHSVFIIPSLLLFAIGIYHIFKVLGVTNRIYEKEIEVVKTEMRKAIEDNGMIRRLDFETALNPQEQSSNDDYKVILENIELSKETWKNKKYRDMNIYEKRNAINAKFAKLTKIIFGYAAIVYFICGFFSINVEHFPFSLFIKVLIGMVFIAVCLFYYHSYLRKIGKQLDSQIFPKKVIETFEELLKNI